MKPKNELTKRKSPRAGWLAYNAGRYFVTVCTYERQSFFGYITNGVMTMTKLGRYLDGLLSDATSHQSYIRVLQHVVMPNHFHAIIEVDSGDVGTRHGVSAKTETKPITDAPWRVPTKRNEDINNNRVGTLRAASAKI